MIIFQLTSDYPPNPLWGMGWHVNFLTDALRRKGNRVFVCTANKSKKVDSEAITTSRNEDSIYLSKNPYEIFNNFKKFLEWQELLANRIIKMNVYPDIIHCHNWMSWLTAKELKKFFPKAKIVSTFHLIQKQYDTMHENPIPNYHDEIIKIEKEMLSLSDKVILLTERQLKLINSEYSGEKYKKKIAIIPLGMYFDKISVNRLIKEKIKNPFLDIVFVGRIERDKGIFQLLNAFQRLSKKYSLIKLNVLGKGSHLESLKKEYSSNKIIFHGFVNRIKLDKILRKSFIFCLPSTSESFGNSVMEAMSLGVVPLFSKGESVPKLYEENKHGLNLNLIKVNGVYEVNQKEIYEKLEYLILNKGLLEEFSRKVFNLARVNFPMDKIVKDTLRLYKEVLK